MMASESHSSSFLSPSSPERDSERVEQYETVTSAEVVRRLQEVRRLYTVDRMLHVPHQNSV